LTGRIGTAQPKAESSPKPVRRRPPTKLLSISEDYKGKKVQAITFQGRRHAVGTWKVAALALFELLRRRDQTRFEETAITLQGRKRPYITRDMNALRMPGPIPNTSLYFETNLSANSIAKLCYTLLVKMGYSRTDLAFEVE
jgi:negative regulator of replication initiation